MRLIAVEARVLIAFVLLALAGTAPAAAQRAPGEQGTENVKVLSHVPLGGFVTVADIEIEAELSRPYVYVSRSRGPAVLDVISVKDPENPELLYRHEIDNPDLHLGVGGRDGKYFKLDGRYYYVQSVQYEQGGADADLGAIVFDVTGLPDPSKVRVVGELRDPLPGGFHNLFAYKHSDGRVLLFTTVSGPHANIYDMKKFLQGDPSDGRIGQVPVPDMPGGRGQGYHDFFIGYDPATGQDKFYGAGAGGYHVYDVTNAESPSHLFSLTGVAGVDYGHTFTPTPDGQFAVTEVEYQYAPLRLFDLGPAQRGETKVINRPIGAWTADWRNLSHNHEVRWPYVFVSAYEDGLQVFNMMDPARPYTVAYYDTYDGPHQSRGPGGVYNGAFGVDVRNADGLVVISDMTTGFWAFRLEGFGGWDGPSWGMPNISSEQNWDDGPVTPRRLPSVSSLTTRIQTDGGP